MTEQSAAPPRVPSILPPGDWDEVHRKGDEFDEGSGWDSERWNPKHWTSGNALIHIDKEGRHATVQGGHLHIEVRKPSEAGKPWRTSVLRSRFKIGGESYLEVRARMVPHAARINSAIWVQQPAGEHPNPNVEIDLQEYHLDNDTTGRQKIHSSLHLWLWDECGRPYKDLLDDRGQTYDTGVDLDDDFHMYGLERHDGKVRLYFDGTVYRTLSQGTLENHPEFLDQERPVIVGCNGLAQCFPRAEADLVVDHVRTFTAR
jgi:beta-glucanase (GH16 family)